MYSRRQDDVTPGVERRAVELVPAVEYAHPVLPADYVRRPRLLQLLDRGATAPLTLLSAPAGSGKTTLVADWMSRRALDNAGWVTFERDDEAFWPGVLGGLSRLGVSSPSGAFPAGATAADRRLVTTLAMVISRAARPFVLVMDGYEMTSKDVARDLDYLLRHCGRRLHIVFATRADPVLPLYRYRLEDWLTEIRMVDLAFTDREAAKLMRRAHVSLSTAPVHTLNERTHGWVAGLRFASRFLGSSQDPDAAIARVSGDSGDIGDYLMGEVLEAQTPENRRLLLSTSIPATIQPGLAEALGGRAATRMLSVLARVNAFVEPVAEQPGFYRYHPFFRELLRAELAYEAPQEMERLQRAAAEWFAHEGRVAASVAHFTEIGAWAEAAGAVVDEMAFAQLLTRGVEATTLAKMLTPIPGDVQDPAASVVRAALALGDGDIERVTAELTHVADTSKSVQDGHGGALSSSIAVLLAVLARGSDDADEAFELAQKAEEALTGRRGTPNPEAEQDLTVIVLASKGIAALRRGLIDQAHGLFAKGAESALTLGSQSLRVECQGYLALIACLRDQLSEAASLADEAVRAADELGIGVRNRSAVPQVALAWVDMEHYDLAGAARHVELATMSEVFLGDRVPETMLALTRSRVRAAEGDVASAISIVTRRTGATVNGNDWLSAQVRFEAAHLKIRNDDMAGAVTEVEGLEQSYPAETALVVAEVRLAEGDDDAFQRALPQALRQEAPARVQVAALLVEASHHLRRGSRRRAQAALHRSLTLAAPEDLRRPFRDACPPVASLLRHDPASARTYPIILGSTPGNPGSTLTSLASVTDDDRPLVVEHLTEKELEVLVHLAELLTTEEIAETMFVSVNTIRTHVRNILRKLGVRRRNAAIRRARELHLIPS